jgi:hypothetical protein
MIVLETLNNQCLHFNLTFKIHIKSHYVFAGFWFFAFPTKFHWQGLLRVLETRTGYTRVSAFWGDLYRMRVYSDLQSPFILFSIDVVNRAWLCVHQCSSIHSWSSALSSPVLPLSPQRTETREIKTRQPLSHKPPPNFYCILGRVTTRPLFSGYFLILGHESHIRSDFFQRQNFSGFLAVNHAAKKNNHISDFLWLMREEKWSAEIDDFLTYVEAF